MKRVLSTLAIVALAAFLPKATSALAQDGHDHAAGEHEMHPSTKAAKDTVAAYPIDYCVVSGEKLGEMGDPVKYDYKGRTVMFCCKGCVKKFEAEPAKYIAALDAAIAPKSAGLAKVTIASAADSGGKPVAKADSASAKPVKLDSLDWCIVSGEKLGEMGKPVPYKYKDREMTFCCKGCIKQFEKNPTAFVARLDSALAGLIKQPEPVQEEHESGHSH